MSTQPEALRLADLLEQIDGQHWQVQDSAADELRRLHAENEKFRKHIEGQNEELEKLIPMAERLEAENERLHQINKSHEMKLSVRGYEIQIADLEAQRDALLEALKGIDKEFKKNGRQHWPEAVKARAAIKAEGSND